MGLTEVNKLCYIKNVPPPSEEYGLGTVLATGGPNWRTLPEALLL